MARRVAAGFGGRVVRLLDALQITQDEAARRAEFRGNTLSDWVNGRVGTPQLRLVRRLAGLGPEPDATLAWLVSGTSPPDWFGRGRLTEPQGYSGEPSIPRRVVREAVGRAWDTVADGAQAGKTVPGEVVALAFGRLTRELALTPPSDNGAGLPHARAAGD